MLKLNAFSASYSGIVIKDTTMYESSHSITAASMRFFTENSKWIFHCRGSVNFSLPKFWAENRELLQTHVIHQPSNAEFISSDQKMAIQLASM